MYKSYYYLNKLAIELNSILLHTKIGSIFSQDKDRIIFQLKGKDELFLEVSVNHNDPFINVRKSFSRAKKNTVSFFEDLIQTNISAVKIANDDRIIKIETGKGNLFFAIRGKHTNLYLIKESNISSFKSEKEEILFELLEEFKSKIFLSNFNFPQLNGYTNKAITDIRKDYKFIGREIEKEVKARSNSDKTDLKTLLELLDEIAKAKPAVLFNKISDEVEIGFDCFKIFSDYEIETFDDIVSAFNHYSSLKHKISDKSLKLKKINNHLDKELKRLIARLNKLFVVIENGNKEDEYNKFANLVLINLNLINAGTREIEVEDIYESGAKLKIKLDEKLSPQKNAENYFEKARDSKINYKKSKDIYLSSKNEFNKLNSYQKELENDLSTERINQIMKELKLKSDDTSIVRDDLSLRFKHYLIEEKYHVFVGKDSANNDLLTTKYAKQNDFWFHARSVSGSHVVLRVENSKEIIPKHVLKKTASLAAFHSKAKTAGVVPVSYTYKKYVIKRKNMPIGQVSLLKEDVLLVKPEIPEKCRYLQ